MNVAYKCYLNYIENSDIVGNDFPLDFDMYKKCILENHTRVISFDEKKMLYRTYVDNSKLITAKTKEALEDKLIEYYSTVGVGTVYLFSEVFVRACAFNLQYEFLAPSTVDRYLADARIYLFNSPYFCKDIRLIIESDIVEFFVELMKMKPKAKMVRNIKTAIRFCFSYARMQEKIDCINITAILREIHFPKHAYAPVIMQDRVLKDIDIDKLLLVLTDKDVDFGILFLFYSGLRVGEVCALHVDDFDFREKTLRVSRTESIRRGLEKKRHCVDVLPKGNKVRTIYLSESALSVAAQLCKGKSGFLFPAPQGGHIHIDTFDHRLRRLCRKAGIPEFSVHDIRRTYATNLIDCGCPDDFVCSQLGHEDINITREYYYYSNKFKKDFRNYAASSDLIKKSIL